MGVRPVSQICPCLGLALSGSSAHRSSCDQHAGSVCSPLPEDPCPPPSQVDCVLPWPHPPMHVFPSVWSTNLTWQPHRGPCSVSSHVCWQPPLP